MDICSSLQNEQILISTNIILLTYPHSERVDGGVSAAVPYRRLPDHLSVEVNVVRGCVAKSLPWTLQNKKEHNTMLRINVEMFIADSWIT